MKRTSGLVVVVLVVLGCGQARAQNHSFEYNLTTGSYKTLTLGDPNHTFTLVTGISGQNVTGFGSTSYTGATLGFLYNGTTYQTFAVPGADGTEPLAISGNEIVGQAIAGFNKDEGFIYDGSKFTVLNVPGAQSTFASGVAGADVVGSYIENGTYHAFLYNTNGFSDISPIADYDSYARAISANGDIIGNYYSSSGEDGFLYNGTSHTTLSVAGAGNTVATGISGNEVVGDYYIGNSIVEAAYAYNIITGTYALLAVPGATTTTATGIDGQNVIGTYVKGGLDYGYVYNMTSETYTTIDIGQLQVIPTGISGNEVIGTYFAPVSVPEPSGIALLGTAMALTAAIARMRRRLAGPAAP